jgi:hypothetical protein
MIRLKNKTKLLILALLLIFSIYCSKKQDKSLEDTRIVAIIKENPWSMIPSMLSTYPYNTYSYFNFHSGTSPFKCGGYDIDNHFPGKKCQAIYTQTLNSKYKRNFTDL